MVINTYHGAYNRSRRSSGLNSIKYFVVHYTSTMASAKNNCIYFATGDRRSSADLFIDRDGSIWEYNNILDGYYSWHCGDGEGKYGITNSNSIGIEVVSDGVDFTDAQIASLAFLYRHYCDVLGRKLEIVRHYDASRKSCPAPYVSKSKWDALKARIEGGSAVPPMSINDIRRKEKMTFIYQPNEESRLIWFDGSKNHYLTHPDQVTAINMAYKNCYGEDIPTFPFGTKLAPWAARFIEAVDL